MEGGIFQASCNTADVVLSFDRKAVVDDAVFRLFIPQRRTIRHAHKAAYIIRLVRIIRAADVTDIVTFARNRPLCQVPCKSPYGVIGACDFAHVDRIFQGNACSRPHKTAHICTADDSRRVHGACNGRTYCLTHKGADVILSCNFTADEGHIVQGRTLRLAEKTDIVLVSTVDGEVKDMETKAVEDTCKSTAIDLTIIIHTDGLKTFIHMVPIFIVPSARANGIDAVF